MNEEMLRSAQHDGADISHPCHSEERRDEESLTLTPNEEIPRFARNDTFTLVTY